MLTVSPVADVMFTQLKALLTAISGFDVDHIVKRATGDLSMPSSPFIQMTPLDNKNLIIPISSWDTTNPNPPVSIQYTEDISNRIQIEFVGPGSEDLANIFTTVFTSDYGVQMLGPQCAPLKIEEKLMLPLDTAEKNSEERWIVRVTIEYQPTVTLPQQFATAATVTSEIIDSSEI